MDVLTDKKLSYFSLRNFILISLSIIWVVLFFLGSVEYQGTWYIYTFFSLVYLALLASGIFWKVTYGYTFLAIILWLGFWLKTVVHLLLDYPLVEPVGLFNDTGVEWDAVLLVASLGAIGVLTAKLTYTFFFCMKSTMSIGFPSSVPPWYEQNKKYLRAGLYFSMALFSVLNIQFSFQQVGLVPKTIIWPLNTLFYWLLSTGFAMAASTVLWWEFGRKNGNINSLYLLLFEATTSSISLLSRGLYIFHITPVFLSLLLNRTHLAKVSLKKISVLLTTTAVTFLLCYPLINSIRDFHYSGVPITMPWETTESLSNGVTKLARFSVDRWVGLEGLMATSATPEKNITLLISVATEKAAIGKASIFQEIALSHYRFMDLNKFVFASLPGPISFLFLSGSYCIVVAGMWLIAFLVLTAELFVYNLLKNPFFSALWGSLLATSVAQMGLNISGLLYYFFLCTLGITTLYLLQNSFFVRTSVLEKNSS